MKNSWQKYLPQNHAHRGTIIKAIDHLEGFINETNLWPNSKKVYIGVSGGVDSVFLLTMLRMLWLKNNIKSELIAIHLNHGTRPENSDEEKLVANLCQKLDLELIIERKKFSLDLKNFEKKARDFRYEVFKRLSEDKHTVYLAHHIDDSLEWSYLQQNRSSNLRSTLGIPLVNGIYKRPLHCFSKAQITYLADLMALDFSIDSSNENLKFERNFLRAKVMPLLDDRYQNRISHYVHNANELAKVLGVSAFKNLKVKAEVKVDRFGGVCLFQLEGKGDFSGLERTIEKTIHRYYPGKRGMLRKGIKQIIEAQSAGKSGPYCLAGGVEVYFYRGMLHFTDRKTRKAYRKWDKQFSKGSKFKRGKAKISAKGVAPFWVTTRKEKGKAPLETIKKSHSLFPNLTEFMAKEKLFLRPYSQLLIKQNNNGSKDWEKDFCSIL